MSIRYVAATAVTFAALLLLPPAAEAFCLYNNSSKPVDLRWLNGAARETSSVFADRGQHVCHEAAGGSLGLFTFEVFSHNEMFCPLPFSTNQTSVTIIDDASRPNGLHCGRDVGPDWKG